MVYQLVKNKGVYDFEKLRCFLNLSRRGVSQFFKRITRTAAAARTGGQQNFFCVARHELPLHHNSMCAMEWYDTR